MSYALKNRTPSIIADEFGELKEEIALLEKKLDELKDEIHAIGEDAIAGERWTVTRSESTSKRLDTKGLRELLGDALAPYEKESKAVRLLVKPTPRVRGWNE